MDPSEQIRKEALRRGYSNKTIIAYSRCVQLFLYHTKKDIRQIKREDILNYVDFLIGKKYSGNTININYCALRFYFLEILGKKLFRSIRYSKIPKKLPIVLSKDEVKLIIGCIKNKKHQLMIKLLYSAGLRVSELVNLRVEDIDLNDLRGWVRKGKGNKDRQFLISKRIKKELEEYVNSKNLKSFLFSGRNGTHSVRTIQEIVKNARKKAKIKKRIHPHTFRHSFATHMIEAGVDLVILQNLMGHNSAETTVGYVHLVKPKLNRMKTPLDFI